MKRKEINTKTNNYFFRDEMQQANLRVIENEEGLPSTLVFSNGRQVLRVIGDGFMASLVNIKSVAVTGETDKQVIVLTFGTEESAVKALDVLQGPVHEMEAAWPLEGQVLVGSSRSTSADPDVDDLAAQFEGTTLAETSSGAAVRPKLRRMVDLSTNVCDSATVTSLISNWGNSFAAVPHKKYPADKHVALVAIYGPNKNELEHDKITKIAAITTRYFAAPDCAEGDNYEFEFEVKNPDLQGCGMCSLTGRIDCVLVDVKTNRFVVLETKTKAKAEHSQTVWVEAVIQARLYAFALKRQLELDYVPDAYVLSTVLYGDHAEKPTPNSKEVIVPGGPYPVSLWKVLGTEKMKSFQEAFPQ